MSHRSGKEKVRQAGRQAGVFSSFISLIAAAVRPTEEAAEGQAASGLFAYTEFCYYYPACQQCSARSQ